MGSSVLIRWDGGGGAAVSLAAGRFRLIASGTTRLTAAAEDDGLNAAGAMAAAPALPAAVAGNDAGTDGAKVADDILKVAGSSEMPN
ncbi:hypothetical protein PG993_002285 [Apiospora rasikravindrae]|uniref:Uncharacterized protein n=1 Tax=Apiospora rasikravindrae TaxID=990691 RepID=A0ABR1TYF6_9PEZI